MFDYLVKRPMLLCGIMCSVISVVGYYFGITLLFFGVISAILISLAAFKFKNPKMIFILSLIFIMTISSVNTYSFVLETENLDDKTLFLEFVVTKSENAGDCNRALVEIKNGNNRLEGKNAEVLYYGGNLTVGKYYKGNIKFRKMQNEYKLMDYSENVFLNGILKDASLIRNKEDKLLILTKKTRDYIRNTVFKYTEYNEASTLCALLFGERGFFNMEFNDNIKRAGVSHVMVVSGMHLAVIVGFFTNFIDNLLHNKYIKAILILAVVLSLTAVCGFTMSMKRAGLTYLLMALALLLNRKSTPANTLGTAVTLILIASPFAIFNVAFQLSVLSTFGILAVALPIMDYIKLNNPIKCPFLLGIFSLIIISTSALLLTLPVVIYVFGYISTVSIISNILISNTVTLTLCAGVAAILASFISETLTAVIMMPCDGLLKYINYIINTLGGWKYSAVEVDVWWTFIAIFINILLFWLLVACKKRKDVLKLKELYSKIINEGGKSNKWR